MRPLLAPLLTFAILLAAAPVAAAQAPAVRLNEVERGFWVGSSVGAVFFPSLPGEGSGSGSGALAGIEAGIDITRYLQVGVLVWGQAIGADADYKGITDSSLDPKGARGDFQSVLAGGTLRLAFLSFADDNGIDRTFVYLRGAGGASLSRPEGVVGDGFWFAAGPGIEYFTRLRHFSVGIEVDAIGMLTDEGQALGFAVLPNLKYSF